MISREKIKEYFIKDAHEYGDAINIGNSQKANLMNKKLHSLYRSAKESNQIDIFLEFINHTDENVRLIAATFSLKVSQSLAEQTLNNLTKLPSITASTAKITLDLWKEGKLELL